eukprot:Skav220760  [mRNA]  locus=scaffold2521:88251:109224:+ [translate_table: standard]
MFDHSYREGTRDDLQDLRDAIERAEEAVSASSSDSEEERERKEDLLIVGATPKLGKAPTLPYGHSVETQKFKLNVCSAMSGEPLAQIRLRPSDSVLQLCEAVVKEMGEATATVALPTAPVLPFRAGVLPGGSPRRGHRVLRTQPRAVRHGLARRPRAEAQGGCRVPGDRATGAVVDGWWVVGHGLVTLQGEGEKEKDTEERRIRRRKGGGAQEE